MRQILQGNRYPHATRINLPYMSVIVAVLDIRPA